MIIMWKFAIILSLVTSLTWAQTFLDECGVCNKEDCPPATDCRAGLVLDRCGCCSICGRLEGEKCDNYTLPLPEKDHYGFCGNNMACLLRNDLEDMDISEALCYCKTQGAVCGTDSKTYASVCKLHEAKIQDDEISVKEWHPCETPPTISSAPENVTANINDDLALSCEVRGYPIPSLIWEFESAATGKKIKLPGDDQMIALQVRGGPEPYMISSWIQILRVRLTDAGIYSCLVVSKKGIVRAEATVQVAKRVKIKPTGKPASTPTPSPVTNGPKSNGSRSRNSGKSSRKEALYQPSG